MIRTTRTAIAMVQLAIVLFPLLLPAVAIQAAPLSDSVHMQIVAHQDDDFLFMNPDLAEAISGGYGVVTVYITAGQSIGTSEGVTPVLTREEFAAARQRGIRAAYAQMAGVANSWTRNLSHPDKIHAVEVYTLSAAPRIRLLFMNLPDGGDDLVPHSNALANIWGDPAYVTDTIVPSCYWFEPCFTQPVPPMFYDRSAVVAVLEALVDEYQPSNIRTLDPQPFQSSQVSYDNTDHTAAARFADAVIANYHGPNATRRHSVQHYKGYSFVNYPNNLGFEDRVEKSVTAFTYQPFDPNYTYFAANYDPWYWVQWERYPGSTTWLEKASDGRLVAVTVEDRRILIWHESTPGGTWNGPVFFPGDQPLSPHLTLILRPDGLLQIFALRLPLEREIWNPDPGLPQQEVVTAVQIPTATTAPIRFGGWNSLGSPDAATCGVVTCQFAGPQSATVDGSGRTFVFAKNSAGRLSYTHSSGGVWAPWTILTSEDIVDGIAAQTRGDGLIEVFVTGRSGRLHRFLQQSGTMLFSEDSAFWLSFGGAASAPTVTKNQDGRPEIFYREANTGRVLTVYQTPSGSWAGPVLLYGDAGIGPVAALRRTGAGHIMLFERNVWSGVSATWQTAPNDVFYLQWQILGGYLNGGPIAASGPSGNFIEYPSAASDAFGRVVVAAKGGDGRLYMRREATAAVGSFGPWMPITAPCNDGLDNDGDGLIDSFDPGCRHADFPTESPECNDQIDNDGDGNIDLADGQCSSASDRSERVDCANGIDDDGDGFIDTADVGCLNENWFAEDPACSDGVDNDLDGLLDWDGAGVSEPDAVCQAAFGSQEVPEPDTHVFVSGVALLLGFASRRRRQADDHLDNPHAFRRFSNCYAASRR